MADIGNAYESKFTGRQIEDVIEFFHSTENNRLLTITLKQVDNDITTLKRDVQSINNKLSSGELEGSFSNVLTLDGGTMHNNAIIASGKAGAGYTNAHNNAFLKLTSDSGIYRPIFSLVSEKDSQGNVTKSFSCGVTDQNTLSFRYLDGSTSTEMFYGTPEGVLMGAAWNDYAEFRNVNDNCAGRVVCECGDGCLKRSTERLQPGAEIISDTFGFAIGKTEKCKIPIAVSGRVLAYPYESREHYTAGDAVCSGPDGTVSKMTREEIREYPERIIGTVSEIPSYETWGKQKIKVDGRIWIRIK